VVQRARDVPELNCRLIELLHEPSGAHVLHIHNDDPENLFCLSFQTLPYSSNGVAHVLEHLVLCGSDAFPVRDPFFSMTRRSMNTYMNALTGTDYTCYPAASQIEQDFYNLLAVYLDAVFHPKLERLSFLQEGHRMSLLSMDGPLTINGVVYNEMKGSLVNPMRRLMKEVCAHLFPNTPYGFDSGGDPKDIPSLTLDELKAFHHTYYHPSRCLFFFYGNLPLQKHLDVLETTVLHSAVPQPPRQLLYRQRRLTAPVFTTMEYPIAQNEPTDKKAYIAFGWLTAQIEDQIDCLALTLLDIVLLETDASLLKYRLLQSGHCRQVSSSCDTEMPQVPFVIVVSGCDGADAATLSTIILSTFEDIARDGLPPDAIEHALHQLELAKSEIGCNGGPFGLSLYGRVGLLAHYGLDPMRGLEIHAQFDALREKLSKEPLFFQQLVRRYFLDNTHLVRIVMEPSSGLEEQEGQVYDQQMSDMYARFDEPARAELIEQERALKQFQETEQDLSCLPTLHLHDVPKSCRHIPLARGWAGSTEWFTNETFTNGLVYLDVVMPLPNISRNDLWLVRLFTALLPQIGCGKRTYQQTLEYLQAYTGGIFASLSLNHQVNDTTAIVPSWHVKTKCLARNLERCADILNDVLLSPNLDDRHRIRELIEKRNTDLENSLTQHALEYAIGRATAPLSEPHGITELLSGLTYLQTIRDLVHHYDEREEEFLDSLRRISQSLLGHQGVHIVACTDEETMLSLREQAWYGLADLPQRPFQPWKPTGTPLFAKGNQAYIIPSSVSFTVAVTPTVCYGSADAPRLAILAQLLNDTFLHRQLREQGGAYGGGAASNPIIGTFSFYSYKDPNLYATLEAYEASVQYILDGQWTDKALEEAKLGVLQDLDSPVAPGSRACVAYAWWRQGKTEQIRQHFRDTLMKASREEIQALIPQYFPAGWSDGSFVTFVGQELLEKDLPLFQQRGEPLHVFPV
jgi:Zn-dependent M16 (insulinase) family peptidase